MIQTPRYFLILAALIIVSAFSSSDKYNYCPASLFFSDTTVLPVIRARDHLGQSILKTNGAVSLISGLDNDYYYSDSNNRTGYLYVETNVASYTNYNQARTPLNISIVIDRSGSMGEDRPEKKPFSKIEYAKKAAKLIVEKLDSLDYVSVVVYDNFINVIQKATPDTCKATIKKKIDAIHPRGATDLWGGTERGYKEAMNFYESGRVNRVLLLSDGQANVGLTDPRQIGKKVQEYRDSGISLSTFGVGLDYNELLMTSMAENGAGNYYLIDSANKITGLFNHELNSLLHVMVQNATLKIKIPPGVIIESGYPYKYDQKGEYILCRFQDLSQYDKKGILLKYRITDKIKAPLVFSSIIEYVDVLDKQHKSITIENTLKPIKDKNSLLSHFNKQVIEQALLFSAGDNLEEAMVLADDGKFSEAKNYIDANSSFFKANSYYVNGSNDLKKMDSTNMRYSLGLSRIKSMTKDSINWMQKKTRAEIYGIRNKKNN
ncbi:MAG: vWA domain-containing protein [Flavisolibacter sp.]